MLTLNVDDYRGVSSWHAALRDADGAVLAECAVRLDERSAEFELLADLYRGLWRLDLDPGRRDASTRSLLARIGAYAAEQVLGDVAVALAARAPAPVALVLPPEAVQLSALPLELATVAGRTLVESGVVFAHQVGQSTVPRQPRPPLGEEPLRLLAVFALPEGASALALVRERRALTSLLRDLAALGKVEAQVMQYGATADGLEAALADPRGWDVVHLSGHGAPGSLQFQDEDGGRQRIDRHRLIEMFRPCSDRTAVVVLSACESGAVQALRRRTPGHSGPPERASHAAEARRPPSVLPSLGHELNAAIGCAVVAMRFPVDDRFSVAFASTWYQALLRNGSTTGEAFGRAVGTAVPQRAASLVSAVTPVLLGDPALRLTTPAPRAGVVPSGSAEMPPGLPAVSAAAPPSPPELFVGRAPLIGRLSRLLCASADDAAGGIGPVLVVGGPGAGKTSCVAEAVEWSRDQVETVRWHRVTSRTTSASLRRAFRPLVAPRAATGTAIVVLDDAEALLTDDGAWRDPDIGAVVAGLCAEAPGRLRVVLVSDRPIEPAPVGTTLIAVNSLSRSESEWLARECQELAWGELGTEAVLPHVGLPWLVCRGHPRLIEYCSQGSVRRAKARTRILDAAWEVTCPTPAPGEPRGRPVLGSRHPGGKVTAWARDRMNALPPAPRLLFLLLADLEASDRRPEIVDPIWEVLQELVDDGAEAAQGLTPLDRAMQPLIDRGLVEISGAYLAMHPAAARAGRDESRRVETLTAHSANHLWTQHYDYFSAQPDGPHQDYLGHVAASCVPYLMRLGRWEQASARAEEAINHDSSPDMASRLLPFLREIVIATGGTPLGRQTRYVRGMVLAKLNPALALEGLHALYVEAVSDGDSMVSLACASGIVSVSHAAGPVQAHEWLRRAQQAVADLAVGQWPLLHLRLQEAQVLLDLDAPAEALELASQVLDEFAQLAGSGVPASGVNPHTLQLSALETAATAAHRLGNLTKERDHRRRALEIARAQGAVPRSLAELQFNQVQTLMGAGRLDEAQALLVAARAHFQNPGDEGALGLVLAGLAELEHLRRHDGDAVDLGGQALRTSYVAGEWLDAAHTHQRMASYLAGTPDSAPEAPVHLLAAAVILDRSAADLVVLRQSPQVLKAIGLLRFCLAKTGSEGIPATVGELSAALRSSTGLDLEAFLTVSKRVPAHRDPPGRLILTAGGPPVPEEGDQETGQEGDSVGDVLTMAYEPPMPSALLDPAGHPEQWQEIVDHVAAAAVRDGVIGVRDLCEDLLSAGWGDLAAAITAIATGDRDVVGTTRPDSPERVVITRILERIQ